MDLDDGVWMFQVEMRGFVTQMHDVTLAADTPRHKLGFEAAATRRNNARITATHYREHAVGEHGYFRDNSGGTSTRG